MSTLKKVTFEYEDHTKTAEGEEAVKWQRNFNEMTAWADGENNNKFVHNPVQFDIEPSEKVQEELDKHVYDMVENGLVSEGIHEDLTVKEDMICPVTKEHCDDECCPVGSECNLSGTGEGCEIQNGIVTAEQTKEDILEKSLAAVDDLTEEQILEATSEEPLSEDEEYEDDSESEDGEETEDAIPDTTLTDMNVPNDTPVKKTIVKKKKKKKPAGSSIKK